MFVILVYDFEQKRVAKALKIARKYLYWVQNSVFEGEITKSVGASTISNYYIHVKVRGNYKKTLEDIRDKG